MNTASVTRKQTSFRLSETLLAKLQEEARRHNRSLNNLVESVLMAFVSDHPNKTTLAAMKEAAKKDDRIAQLTTQYQAGVPQYAIKVDRDKAKLLGLSVDDIYSTLAQFMGGSYVNDFVKFGRTYQVNLSADSESRSRIGKLGRLSVRNANGNMVPFSSFISIEPAIGQSTVSRYNMYTTASITGTPAGHVSSKETIKAMEEILDEAAGD